MLSRAASQTMNDNRKRKREKKRNERNEVYISKAIIRFVNKLTFTSKQHSSIHSSKLSIFQLIDTVVVNHKRSNFKLMEFNKSSKYKIHYQHFCLQNFLNRIEFFLVVSISLQFFFCSHFCSVTKL